MNKIFTIYMKKKCISFLCVNRKSLKIINKHRKSYGTENRVEMNHGNIDHKC